MRRQPKHNQESHVNKKLTRACSLLAAPLGLFTARPTKAASLQLVGNWGAGALPTNVSMYICVPDSLLPAKQSLYDVRHICNSPALQ